MSRIVVALGGNALIRRGQEGSTAVQRRNLLGAARALADLDRLGHTLVLTHGNGPRVGFLAIEAEAARQTVPPPPLDVLAESVDADALLLLTDISAVHLRWTEPDRMPVRRLTLAGVAAGVEDGTFAAGSMGPKVTAAAEFVRRTGRFAAIGAVEDAVAVLEGRSGTSVVNDTLIPV